MYTTSINTAFTNNNRRRSNDNNNGTTRTTTIVSSVVTVTTTCCLLLLSLSCCCFVHVHGMTPLPPNMNHPSKITLRAGVIHAPPFSYIIKEEEEQEEENENKNYIEAAAASDNNDKQIMFKSASLSENKDNIESGSGLVDEIFPIVEQVQALEQQQQQQQKQVVSSTSYRFEGFCIDLINKLQLFALQDNVELDIQLLPSDPQDYFIALDLISNDCNTTMNPHPMKDCNKYDMLIADYWSSPERIIRVDMTPPFLRTAFTTMKYLDSSDMKGDYTTISQVNQDNETVCILNDSFVQWILFDEYPNTNIIQCTTQDECIVMLKQEQCVLYFDEELQLRYVTVHDDSLQVTVEKFFTQYIVWPFKYSTNSVEALLLRRWMMAAVKNKTIESLYYNYFQKHKCELGWSGINCTIPCNPNHGIDNGRGICVCESTRYIGTDCSIEVIENINLIPPILKLIGTIMVIINVGCAIGCAIWLYIQRYTIQVRIIQPFFLSLVLLGCIISSSTIIALGQECSNDGPVNACVAIPWLYSVGFSITFGVLFAKIRRVYLIFVSAVNHYQGSSRRNNGGGGNNSNNNNKKKNKYVTVSETLIVVGAVLVVDVTILIIWTIIDPLHWERDTIQTDKYGYVLESIGYCTSYYWQLFSSLIGILHLSLMSFACYLCYVSRAIPTEFSEHKYVIIAMISNLQIYIVGIPVLIILGSDPKTSYFVRSVIIWMNDLVVLILIFGNLIYSVHFANEDDDYDYNNNNEYNYNNNNNNNNNRNRNHHHRSTTSKRNMVTAIENFSLSQQQRSSSNNNNNNNGSSILRISFNNSNHSATVGGGKKSEQQQQSQSQQQQQNKRRILQPQKRRRSSGNNIIALQGFTPSELYSLEEEKIKEGYDHDLDGSGDNDDDDDNCYYYNNNEQNNNNNNKIMIIGNSNDNNSSSDSNNNDNNNTNTNHTNTQVAVLDRTSWAFGINFSAVTSNSITSNDNSGGGGCGNNNNDNNNDNNINNIIIDSNMMNTTNISKQQQQQQHPNNNNKEKEENSKMMDDSSWALFMNFSTASPNNNNNNNESVMDQLFHSRPTNHIIPGGNTGDSGGGVRDISISHLSMESVVGGGHDDDDNGNDHDHSSSHYNNSSHHNHHHMGDDETTTISCNTTSNNNNVSVNNNNNNDSNNNNIAAAVTDNSTNNKKIQQQPNLIPLTTTQQHYDNDVFCHHHHPSSRETVISHLSMESVNDDDGDNGDDHHHHGGVGVGSSSSGSSLCASELLQQQQQQQQQQQILQSTTREDNNNNDAFSTKTKSSSAVIVVAAAAVASSSTSISSSAAATTSKKIQQQQRQQ